MTRAEMVARLISETHAKLRGLALGGEPLDYDVRFAEAMLADLQEWLVRLGGYHDDRARSGECGNCFGGLHALCSKGVPGRRCCCEHGLTARWLFPEPVR